MITPKCKITPLGGEKKLSITHKAAWIVGFRLSETTFGYSGVYSSFLLHTHRAAEKFGVDARDILVELGRRKTVGGQEDMIVDVAFELSQKNLR